MLASRQRRHNIRFSQPKNVGSRLRAKSDLLLAERNFEVHELVSVGVIDSGDDEARALGGVVEVSGIKEKEALLRGVGLDGIGGKGGVVEFVAIILRESAVGLVAARKRERNLVLGARARGADGGEGSAKIVERISRGLGAVSGDELEVDVAQDDGLVAIIGKDDEDGQDGVLEQLGVEERSLGGRVIRIGTESELLLRVRVVGSHGGGRNDAGHDEVPGKGG